MNVNTKLLPDRLRNIYLEVLNPLIDLIAKLRLHPNVFTTASFVLGCSGGILMAAKQVRLASALFLMSGIFDSIDGNLARKTGKESKFGALFDSALDRYSETIYFIGIAFFFLKNGSFVTAAVVAIGLTGSFMVSYVRARAESLGYRCEAGLVQRPERVVLLGLSGLIHLWALTVAVWAIAVLSNFTTIQRMVYIWKTDQQTIKQPNRKD